MEKPRNEESLNRELSDETDSASMSNVLAPGSAPPLPGLFVGREEDVARLRMRLGVPQPDGTAAPMHRLTVIRGWPGVGKTAFAAVLAHDPTIAALFPDGILWASLGQRPSLFAELIAWGRALGHPDLGRTSGIEEASAQLAALLRHQRRLLIVDDVWDAAHLQPFQVGGPQCALLLSVALIPNTAGPAVGTDHSENYYESMQRSVVTTRLPSVARDLAAHPDDIYVLGVLHDAAVLDLLRMLAPNVVEADPDDSLALVQELEGSPIAIQVAGRLLHTEASYGFGVESLLVEIRQRAAILRAQAPADRAEVGVIPSVTALLQKSTDLLDPYTLDCFALLGAFAPKPATFDEAAMQAVWETNNPRPVIRTLVDRGLIEPVGQGQFWMHALLVEHARSLLAEDRAISLHLEVIALYRRKGDRSSESKSLVNLAKAYAAAGDLSQAIEAYEQALAISRQIGDRAVEENALNYLSATYSQLGDTQLAADYYQQLLVIAHNKDEQPRAAEILLALGTLARSANQPELAKQHWTESRHIYARLRLPHEASVSALLMELELAHRGLFSLQEIARSYLQAAGFDLQPGPDSTVFVAVPRDPFWQQNLDEPVVIKVVTGAPLDLDGVMALVHAAHELLSKNPCHIFVICDRAPTDRAWLQIGAVRDKGVKVMPIDDTILAIGQQEGRQRGRLFDYLEDRFLGPRRDLYDRQNPISDRLNFFGREQLAERLMEMLLDGNAVALFGLRKMGKSSLLNYLREKLPSLVALVDLQAGVELAGIYTRVLNDWARSIRTKVPDLSWEPPSVRGKTDPSDRFVAAVGDLLNLLEQRGAAARLAVLVDEIELMAAPGRGRLQRYLSFTRTLRGLTQERPGSFMLMIAGVDPAIVRTNRFSGQQNPFYSFFREEYLPPLNLADCKQMIRNIGVQMGLEYTDEALDFVAQVSGGHPYWARKLCSVAFRSWDGNDRISLDQLLNAARSFVEDPSTAYLLNERGLWGEVTDPHLWPRPQITANKNILISLAQAESQRKEELVRAPRQSGVYNESLYELNQRLVLGQPQTNLYLIQLRLFRNWIRSDKLGED